MSGTAPSAGVTSATVATAFPAGNHVATGLTPVAPGARVAAPAYTVHGSSGDNLALHRAVEAAPPGSVLVAQLDGDRAAGHWGELLTQRAMVRGLAGLVLDHTLRDVEEIAALGFAAFHRGTWPGPATKEHAGRLAVPIEVLGLAIAPGDLVVADVDGLVVVPRDRAGHALAAAAGLADREAAVAAGVREGGRLCDLLGFALPDDDAPQS